MNNSEKKTYLKRKNYFIEKPFQTKFILKFCLLVAVGGLLTIGILYFLAMQSTTVAFVNSRVVVKTTADFILPILIQTVVIVMIIVSIGTMAVTLFVSHKIAGPLYRFKKVMKTLEEGNFSSNFRIRTADQLKDLADAFNNMIIKIRTELKTIKDNFFSLDEKLNNISEEDVVEKKRSLLSELKRISGELNKKVDHFKT